MVSANKCPNVLDQLADVDHCRCPAGNYHHIPDEVFDTRVVGAETDKMSETDVRSDARRVRPKSVVDDLVTKPINGLVIRIERRAQS